MNDFSESDWYDDEYEDEEDFNPLMPWAIVLGFVILAFLITAFVEWVSPGGL